MADHIVKIIRILLGYMVLSLSICAVISLDACAADLVLNGPHFADPNSLISFTVIIHIAPNDVEAFGFDILFDPNILDVVADPNGVVTLEKGNLIDQSIVLAQKISLDRVRIGGILFPVDTNKIFQSSTGTLVKVPFRVKRTYSENDIRITSTVDDISSWTTETILGAWLFLPPDSESGLCFMNSLI